jgi:DNA-binding winged helix-turn-helix (wHTH) protein
MNADAKVVYEFGPFRMDPDKQVLLRDGQLIALNPKTFETLLVLVRRGREVVSKEELLKEIWPDSFVGEANLSQRAEMAAPLGDSSSARNQYQEFLALWKDADPDLPVLHQARTELLGTQ